MTATRQDLANCKAEVNERMDDFHSRLLAIEDDTKRTREIVEAWDSAKGFVNVIRGLSATLKILAPILIVIGGFFYFITHGTWPNK